MFFEYAPNGVKREVNGNTSVRSLSVKRAMSANQSLIMSKICARVGVFPKTTLTGRGSVVGKNAVTLLVLFPVIIQCAVMSRMRRMR